MSQRNRLRFAYYRVNEFTDEAKQNEKISLIWLHAIAGGIEMSPFPAMPATAAAENSRYTAIDGALVQWQHTKEKRRKKIVIALMKSSTDDCLAERERHREVDWRDEWTRDKIQRLFRSIESQMKKDLLHIILMNVVWRECGACCTPTTSVITRWDLGTRMSVDWLKHILFTAHIVCCVMYRHRAHNATKNHIIIFFFMLLSSECISFSLWLRSIFFSGEQSPYSHARPALF